MNIYYFSVQSNNAYDETCGVIGFAPPVQEEPEEVW